MFAEELAGFHRKPEHKNGKEANFVALYRVLGSPLHCRGSALRLRSGTDSVSNGYAALPIRPHAL